jgi:hypothetical protein
MFNFFNTPETQKARKQREALGGAPETSSPMNKSNYFSKNQQFKKNLDAASDISPVKPTNTASGFNPQIKKKKGFSSW